MIQKIKKKLKLIKIIRFVRDSSKYWYKPNISREEAVNLLRNAHPGTFIVRDSTTFANAFGLVLKVIFNFLYVNTHRHKIKTYLRIRIGRVSSTRCATKRTSWWRISASFPSWTHITWRTTKGMFEWASVQFVVCFGVSTLDYTVGVAVSTHHTWSGMWLSFFFFDMYSF